MYWDVKTVKPLADYQLYVEIEDGRCGIFDVKPYLEFGMFRELKNIHYFNQVDILYGAITWPNEQDIAPETLLEKLLPINEEDQYHLIEINTISEHSREELHER